MQSKCLLEASASLQAAPCKSCLSTLEEPPEAAELSHGSELGSFEKVRFWTAIVWMPCKTDLKAMAKDS